MLGYGVSYAVASLSCTVGPFLAVTAAGFALAYLFHPIADGLSRLGMPRGASAFSLAALWSKEGSNDDIRIA